MYYKQEKEYLRGGRGGSRGILEAVRSNHTHNDRCLRGLIKVRAKDITQHDVMASQGLDAHNWQMGSNSLPELAIV